MLEPILAAIAAIMVLIIVVVVLRRSDFCITRSATISADVPAAFAQVNDFHHWQAWSPWAHLDPAIKNIYEGAPAGTGAIFTWIGNSKAGEGTMTILESRPDTQIRIKLEFRRPFKGSNDVEFTFEAGRQANGGHMEHGGPKELHHEGCLTFHEHG